MKKFSFLKWAIPALCLYACQADLTEPVSLTEVQETVLTAVIESSSQTRTSLSPAEAGVSRVLWSEGDRIRVFFGCPSVWKDASFSKMRAVGAFLVSAERENGTTSKISVTSEQGGRCRIETVEIRRN